MNAARAAVIAVISFAGVAIPATSAHADDPLLCGLVDACDGQVVVEIGVDSESAPIDDGSDIDPGLDLDTGADVELSPNSSTLLTANSDVDQAGLQPAAANPTLAAGSDATFDTDASVGLDGIIVSGDGGADSRAAVTTWDQLGSADTTTQFCGVQVVILASSSAICRPHTSGAGSSNDGLFAVAESVDLCGAQVAVSGSATADCGESAPAGSTAAGLSWILARTAQEAPVPGADPDGSGTGTSGTGTTGAAAGAGSSPAAGSPAQAPNDEGNSGTTAGESGGSLPLTGTSVLLLLVLAAAVVATGLVALRSSQIQVRHQS